MEIVTVITFLVSSFFFIWFAFQLPPSNKALRIFLMFIALLMIYQGFAAAYVSTMTPEPQLALTDEYSYYWNCSMLRNNCTGTPAPASCAPYTHIQCLAVPGCAWSDQEYCYGTPTIGCEWLGLYEPINGTKCTETLGCMWNLTMTPGTCDRVITLQNYTNYTQTGNNILAQGGLTLIQYILLFLIAYFFIFFFISLMEYLLNVMGNWSKR
jgi:hypothetical protein